jgi:RNA polymerase sigma-70 factor (ECF subfamily)
MDMLYPMVPAEDAANADPSAPEPSPPTESAEALLAHTYGELRRLAARYLRSERPDHTLQPTALVHEAWCRLSGHLDAGHVTRDRFLATAATVMRRILVDHARARGAEKRGGDRSRITLNPDLIASDVAVDVVALDDALERLRSIDARQARLVELRFFGGLSLGEAAALMELSPRSADREWSCAKAWLWEALHDERSEGA